MTSEHLDESWSGGHYELVVHLGERSPIRAATALRALWAQPPLDGCFLSRTLPPTERKGVNPNDHLEETLYGIATLPNETRVPCGSALWQFEDGSDWIALFLPLGSISKGYPVGPFPFIGGYPDWQREVDDWLRKIADRMFKVISFDLAIIGFEVDFSDAFIENVQEMVVPDERLDGWLLRSGRDLKWYPPTTSTNVP